MKTQIVTVRSADAGRTIEATCRLRALARFDDLSAKGKGCSLHPILPVVDELDQETGEVVNRWLFEPARIIEAK